MFTFLQPNITSNMWPSKAFLSKLGINASQIHGKKTVSQ